MSVDWADWRSFREAPGRPLADLKRRAAQGHFATLMDRLPERLSMLEGLLRVNGVEIGTDDRGIQSLNDWYLAHVAGVNADQLEDRWAAVGLDIGLYLGEAIIERAPRVEWRLFTEGERDISFQRPVLMGFRTENPLHNVDPEILILGHGLRHLAGDDEPRDYFVQVVKVAAGRG